MTYIFYYRNMDIGGCQLLIQKIAAEMVRHGYQSIVVCQFISEDILNELKFSSVKIFKSGAEKWYNDSVLKEFLQKYNDTEVRILSFLWDDFCRLHMLKLEDQKLLFYAIHPNAIVAATYSRNSILKIFRKLFLSSTLRKLFQNHSIVAMDKETIWSTAKYYNIKKLKLDIVHIPVDISEDDFNEKISTEKFKSDERVILAIARADFPFKGYLLGLIDLFKNERLLPNFKLIIVSYGNNYGILEEKYRNCSQKIQERITLFGRKSYVELKELFEQSHIYVGMGTTLLDASKYGTISIPVVPYSYEVRCHDFFHICNTVTLEDGSEDNFIRLLKLISFMNEKNVLPLVKSCREIVKREYSSQSCAEGLERAFMEIVPKKLNRINISYLLRKKVVKISKTIRG